MRRLNTKRIVLGVAGLFLLASPLAHAGDEGEGASSRPGSEHQRPTRVDRTDRSADPYGIDRARLGVLEAAQPDVMGTPRPSASVQRRYDRYIESVVDADNTLDVIEGRPRILVLRQPPVRVQIPDDEIARYDVLTERELSVTGVSVGTTMLNIWFADPNNPDDQEILSYLVRVLPDPEMRSRLERDFQALEGQINTTFPSSRVRIRLLGDSVIVEGQAKDAFEAERIMEVVRSNAPRVQGYVPGEGGEEFGSGVEYSLDEGIRRDRFRVVNLMRIPGAAQVALRVTIAEVNRAAARSIGLNFSLTDDDGLTFFEQLTGAALGFTTNLPIFLDNGQVELAINALRTLNLARSLAEPTLTAMNGESASFRAGGEFPVPVVTGATAIGLQGVEFIPFGVSLTFKPVLLDRDRVRLFVRAEVSTRSLAQGTTTIQNAEIPSLDTRNFTTTVELRAGQTLAVAGLIQQTFGSTGDRVPGLGDLPLIGNLFGFNRTTSSEQELIVLVTPELVLPMDPELVPQNLPGADIFEPDDIEFYLLGRLESKHAEDARTAVLTTPDRLGRQRALERKFIVGPAGHADGH